MGALDIVPAISVLVEFICVAIVSFFFSRRLLLVTWNSLLPSKVVVLFLFMCITFIILSGFATLVHEGNALLCTGSMLLCIILYAGTKLAMYFFFVEKLQLLSFGKKRHQSCLYIMCLVGLLPYVVILVLMLLFFIAKLDPLSQACSIGLQEESAIPLAVYDFIYSLFQTSLFIYKVRDLGFISTHRVNITDQERSNNSKYRALAVRMMIAAAICLVSSAANITFLAASPQGIPAHLCLLFCSLDITVNALAVYWTTDKKKDKEVDAPTANTKDSVQSQDGNSVKRPLIVGAYKPDNSTNASPLYQPPEDDIIVVASPQPPPRPGASSPIGGKPNKPLRPGVPPPLPGLFAASPHRITQIETMPPLPPFPS